MLIIYEFHVLYKNFELKTEVSLYYGTVTGSMQESIDAANGSG